MVFWLSCFRGKINFHWKKLEGSTIIKKLGFKIKTFQVATFGEIVVTEW